MRTAGERRRCPYAKDHWFDSAEAKFNRKQRKLEPDDFNGEAESCGVASKGKVWEYCAAETERKCFGWKEPSTDQILKCCKFSTLVYYHTYDS